MADLATKLSSYSATKLSKDTRASIVNVLMEHRFRDEVVEMHKEEAALTKRVYEAIYPKAQRDAMATMEAKWPDSFSVSSNFYVSVQGMSFYIGTMVHDNLSARGLSKYRLVSQGLIEEREKFLVPPGSSNNRRNLNQMDDKLADDVEAFLTKTRKFKEEYNKASKEAHAAVESFHSGRNLVAGWPEVVPLVKDLLPLNGTKMPRTAMLPAVRLAELNAAFHLPPEEGAKA